MYVAAEQTYDALRKFGPKMGPGKMRERMIYAITARLRARDAEVRADERAKVLAGFTREDVAPFFGHGHTSPGYWRLVGPKHYKPISTPEAMSQEAIDELRRRLIGRSES